jgi:hypothetical protein
VLSFFAGGYSGDQEQQIEFLSLSDFLRMDGDAPMLCSIVRGKTLAIFDSIT